ncbi:hypothetical protein FA13DRAFT_1714739 [Coprinellus micaceus]|uniref:Uncharacterized protein n=1 Tax=Coprinellus micaceus TaxID=71717 RepID=A0A4Y7SRK2_COPMI|nr:hypothetical protein FA13DRAFT_1714739 [Coprinellus micaceus]
MSSEHPPLADIREEAPSGAVSREASEPTLHNHAANHHEHPPHPHHPRPRRQSTASRVSVDFFDPEGMIEIRRTLTQDRAHQEKDEKPRAASTGGSSTDSDNTLAAGGDGFDLEKTIRQIVRRTQPTFHFRGIKTSRHPPLKDILSGFEGVVKPGEMLLVLGSPGAGCSTLLKTVANHRDEYYAVDGEVHYDSISPGDLQKYFRGDVQYCPEDDVHFPTLSVEQTLDFAGRTRNPETAATTHEPNSRRREEASIDRRIPCHRACIGCWDKCVTASSDMIVDLPLAVLMPAPPRVRAGPSDCYRHDELGDGGVMLYQAGESLYQHFDKVCVIYEGRMAYFGPADKAKGYFIEMGFTAQPRTADEFAEFFRASKAGKENTAEVEQYISEYSGKDERAHAYAQSARAEFAKRSGKKNPYMLTIPQQVAAVMRRKVQIIRGNMLATGLNLFSYIFQAIIMGTVFLRMPEETTAFFSRGGVLFLLSLRHEKAALYHPFVEALAHTLVDVPITLVIMIVFSVLLYFMIGLQRSAEQFFIFFLFLFTMSLTMKSWFRAIAAAFKSEATAQAFAGYTIPKPSMIGALRWITYINRLQLSSLPAFRYGFEAILTNEFRTLKGACTTLVPQGPGYENVSLANQPGQDYVDGALFTSLSYGFSYSNIWKNFGIIIAFGVGFTIALLIFAEYNTSTSGSSSVTLFKKGSKTKKATKSTSNGDEEKGGPTSPIVDEKRGAPAALDDVKPPPQTDVFTWKNVNYSVPIPGEADRKLLADISGFVAPGKLTALMESRGLARRLCSTFWPSGYMWALSLVWIPMSRSRLREALLFSAKLRQPPFVPLAEKEAYVEKCLKICGLEEYAEAAIGSLNIEFRKRTTIAVELAAKPKLLLFLDEPTSGLDSQSAWAIVSFLRSLADQGQAILCIRSHASAKEGRQTVYFGDLGSNSTTMIDYFERNGARKCEGFENPAEYMLDVIGAGATATAAQDWYGIWQASPEASGYPGFRSMPSTLKVVAALLSRLPYTRNSRRRGSFQVKELFMREAQAYWRDPTYLMAKFALNVIAGLFVGFTFYKSKDTQQGTQNKLFAIFMITIISWTALITAQIMIEIPWNVITATLLFFTWFWTVGFPNDRAGYTYLIALGHQPHLLLDHWPATVYSKPFSQLGWWRWMYRLSPYTYLIEGLFGPGPRQATHQLCTCRTTWRPFMSYAGGYLSNPEATSDCQFCSSRTTDQLLELNFNIFYGHRWRNVGFMVAFIVFNAQMGRGSVSALIASIFSHAQSSLPLTVGRFNSPHLVHITDCILINEKPIDHEEYLATRKHGGDAKLTLFEVLTLTALQLFEKARVDVAVVEVGMGGITDATNVIPSECIMASALTSVDLDHQGFLGNTVYDIATKKAGIARPGKPFVMGPQKPHRAFEVHRAVRDTVEGVGAILTGPVGVVQLPDNSQRRADIFQPLPPLPVQFTLSAAPLEPIKALLPLHGDHQVENLMTALGVIQALYSRRDPLDIPGLLTPKAMIHGIGSVSWRGRLSWHTYKGHQVLVDGAHNPASSQALSQYLAGISPRKAKKIQVTFVLALSHSPPKQPQDTLEPFLSLSTPPPQLTLSAAFVPFTPPTDMPWVKFVPPSELAKVAEKILQPRGSIWTPGSNRPWRRVHRTHTWSLRWNGLWLKGKEPST